MDSMIREAKEYIRTLFEGNADGHGFGHACRVWRTAMKIAETEPGARGGTATNVTKPAKIENGYEIAVPLFVNEGDIIRIDTRTGEYADRVSKG